MTREQKIYCKIGQAICNLIGTTMVLAMFIAPCVVADYIANLFL